MNKARQPDKDRHVREPPQPGLARLARPNWFR
jgi:hypothetical protein